MLYLARRATDAYDCTEWPLIIHGARSFRKYSRCRSLIPADTARNLKTEKQKNRAFPPFMSRREECAGRKKIFLGTYFSFIRARACTRDAYKNQAGMFGIAQLAY